MWGVPQPAHVFRRQIKLQKATIASARLFVCPSACLRVSPSAWNNLAPTARIFMKFYIWGFYRKSVEKNFHENLTRITVLYMKTYVHLLQYLA